MRVMKSPSGSRANVWLVETLMMNRGGSLYATDAVTCSALPDQYEPVPTLALAAAGAAPRSPRWIGIA